MDGGRGGGPVVKDFFWKEKSFRLTVWTRSVKITALGAGRKTEDGERMGRDREIRRGGESARCATPSDFCPK